MRRAIARDFAALPDVRVTVTVDERLDADPGSYEIVRIRAGTEPRVFESLAGRADYTLAIAPETDGILAERARIVERARGRSLGSSPAAVMLAADKLEFAHHLVRNAIPTPPCRLVHPARGLPAEHPYPAVLKPRDGAGSINTFVISGADDVPDAARSLESAILQPLVPGTPLSASFLVGPTGAVRLVGVARQRIVIERGRISYQGGEVPAPRDWLVPDVVAAVRSVAGLRGFVGVDFVYDDGARRAAVIELNPRPTTSVVGLLALLPPGRLARAWLAGDEDLAGLVHACDPVVFGPDAALADGKGPIRS